MNGNTVCVDVSYSYLLRTSGDSERIISIVVGGRWARGDAMSGSGLSFGSSLTH